MLRIDCPWCGPRDLREFSYGGEAHIARPRQPGTLGDDEWADYLFNNSNTKGLFRERWMHAHGCGRWFNVVRNTVTDEILAIYEMGERPPVDELGDGVKTADSEARPELRVEAPGDR
ncbi:MAG: sarcosine oxidase subunit delta [Alphaproteobacteria bacterium]|nr:sarcosine oxidase subunit delta [Alphaproteobacteria bacterium]